MIGKIADCNYPELAYDLRLREAAEQSLRDEAASAKQRHRYFHNKLKRGDRHGY
jgi:hypothetical protein